MIASVVALLFGLLLLIAPGLLWQVQASLTLRTPGAVEPSRRQRAFWQISGVVVTTLGLVGLVLSVGPADFGHAARACALIAWVGAAAIVVLLVRALRLNEDDLPPNEPSGTAYGFWTVLFVGLALVAVVAGGAAWSVPTDDEREAAWATAASDTWGAVLDTDAEQFTTAPQEAAVDPVGSYVVIDREAQEPAQLWAAAERMGPTALERLKASDLLLIANADFRCAVDGAVVHEDDGEEGAAVQVALVSHDRRSLAPCLEKAESPPEGAGVLVTLDDPLGERDVIGLDHADCTVERPAPPSMTLAGGFEVDHCRMSWPDEPPDRWSYPFETLDSFEM